MRGASYRHTQSGIWFLALFAVAIFIMVVISSFQGWRWTSAIVLGVLLIIAFLFPSLTVEVGEGRIRCWFGSGLIRKTLNLPATSCGKSPIVKENVCFLFAR